MEGDLSTTLRKRQDNKSLAFAILLLGTGMIFVTLFALTQQAPPSPQINQTYSISRMMSDGASTDTTLPYSKPAKIRIPAIDVQAEIITVGKDKDGSISVPADDDFNKAAWYEHSPTPGQVGSSVIQGHVDYVGKGPAVFFNLGDLKQGDKIEVTRKDGRFATFTVNSARLYDKTQFPTAEVYGVTNRPSLVLMTCAGELDRESGEYDSNVVVYSTLTSVK